MKISVVLCTYNGEAFLVEQLDSIRLQTKSVAEVLIADDRSTDSTVHIIKEYIEKYKLSETWKLNINEKNKGYANNFHDIMMRATGDIIFLSDQDDIWNNDKVEKMAKKMEEMPEIQLLGTEFTPFYSSDHAPQYTKKSKNDNNLYKIEINRKNIFIDNGCEGCAVCVRKNFLHQINKYWFPGFPHDEFVWKMSLCYQGCYKWNISLMNRRFHENNTSKQKLHDKNKRIQFLENLLKSHMAMMQCANDRLLPLDDRKLISKNIKSVETRIRVLKNRSIFAGLKGVVKYYRYYQSWKSPIMELYIAFFGK